MRKIAQDTLDVVRAMHTGERTNPFWKKQNMTVTRAISVGDDVTVVTVYLHGNAILKLEQATGKIHATLAGWDTVTTRSRLNDLLRGLDVDSRSWFFRMRGVTCAVLSGNIVPVDTEAWYTVGEYKGN